MNSNLSKVEPREVSTEGQPDQFGEGPGILNSGRARADDGEAEQTPACREVDGPLRLFEAAGTWFRRSTAACSDLSPCVRCSREALPKK